MGRFAPYRVALLLGQDLGYCRDVLSGILAHAEANRLNWTYHEDSPDKRVLPLLKRWKPDGIIAHLSDKKLARGLMRLALPLVSITHTFDEPGTPVIDVDHEKVGEEAARYFLSLGYRSFGYYGSREAAFSRRREQGFRVALERQGFSVSPCHAEFFPRIPITENWSDMEKQAARWLHRLPKPVAILASNDLPARTLCQICRLSGLRVPKDVAILGVDNDSSECRLSSPPLSSIAIPSQTIGQLAAEMLDGMIRKKRLTSRAVFLPPQGVIARESTGLRSTLEPRLRDALLYIQEHAGKEITTGEVCTFLKMSRRAAERLFHDKLASTIHGELQLARIRLAQQLLLKTDFTIAEIAERAGFNNPRRFHRVFSQYEDCNPTDYRRGVPGAKSR